MKRYLPAALALAFLAGPACAAEPQAPFVIELVDALSALRGGPVRARPVSAPEAVRLQPTDAISGDARIETMPDGSRRMTIRWTVVKPQRGASHALTPPGETVLRTSTPEIAAGTRLRVSWAPGRGLTNRDLDLPEGPNAAQAAILERAREAARLGPPGTGTVITLDMLTGRKANPLDPGARR